MNRWYFHFSRSSPLRPGGGSAFKSRRFEVPADPHRGLAGGVGPRRVIVAERGRLGNVALVVQREVLVVRVPRAVRGLVVAHQEERLVLGPVLEEVDRQIGDDVGHVALDLPAARGLEEGRVVIDALARQDRPAVEAGRVAAQVPLADHARMVAGRLQVLGDGRLRAVEAVEHRHAVLVAVLAGQDAGPAGRADRVDAEAGVQSHALVGEAVEVRRLVDPAAGGVSAFHLSA